MSQLRAVVQGRTENILFEGCTTIGVRNYDQKLSSRPDSSALRSGRFLVKCVFVLWLVYCASPPQVRGESPRLGKVDSAFHPFSGSIMSAQLAWELNPDAFSSD
ncbi:hypothetical protein TNCV_1627331 [Trichonephila clavipes]|nr:hypothetical protein TNCV_1627331 [Trichonephila clavipes]